MRTPSERLAKLPMEREQKLRPPIQSREPKLRVPGAVTVEPIDEIAQPGIIEHQFTIVGSTNTAGVEEHDAGGVRIRVYSAAKTVADCFKFRNKIGIEVAVEALKDFTRRYRGGASELARYARICRVSRVMQPYLDSIS